MNLQLLVGNYYIFNQLINFYSNRINRLHAAGLKQSHYLAKVVLFRDLHLVLCVGGKERDLLSEGMMGLQADVTETSQNSIQNRTWISCFSVVIYNSAPL